MALQFRRKTKFNIRLLLYTKPENLSLSIDNLQVSLMKKLLLILIPLVFVCCNSSSDRSKEDSPGKQFETSAGRNFFDYDEIDYYFSRYGDMDVVRLDENRSRSEIDSLKVGVILGNTPKDISDTLFISKLETLGYKAGSVDKSKFAEIDKIFVEKPAKQWIGLSCIRIYNDILIFKKQKKVIGTAKVCLGCLAHQMTGTTADTQNFGQDGDYEKLGNLLGK